jgi:hypothetical protein
VHLRGGGVQVYTVRTVQDSVECTKRSNFIQPEHSTAHQV